MQEELQLPPFIKAGKNYDSLVLEWKSLGLSESQQLAREYTRSRLF